MKANNIFLGQLTTSWFAALLLIATSHFNIAQAGHPPVVTLHTNMGDVVLEVDMKNAPVSAANFLNYARNGFYNNTIFHRVIPGYMIQGGGFDSHLEKKVGHAPVQNEANNGILNLKGTVALARRGNPHSATSQFFINLNNNTALDHKAKTRKGWGYSVFAQIIDGMSVLAQMETIKTAKQDKFKYLPLQPIIIEKVSIKNDIKASSKPKPKPRPPVVEDAKSISEKSEDATDDEDNDDGAANEEEDAELSADEGDESNEEEDNEVTEDDSELATDEDEYTELADDSDENAQAEDQAAEEIDNDEEEAENDASEDDIADEAENDDVETEQAIELLPKYAPEPPDVPAMP